MISVKDRLPTINEWVLGWSPEDDGPCLTRLLGRYDGERNWFVVPLYSQSFKSTCAITHWQPLPTNPEETIPCEPVEGDSMEGLPLYLAIASLILAIILPLIYIALSKRAFRKAHHDDGAFRKAYDEAYKAAFEREMKH